MGSSEREQIVLSALGAEQLERAPARQPGRAGGRRDGARGANRLRSARVPGDVVRVGLLDQHDHGLQAAAVAIDDVVERRPDLEHAIVIAEIGGGAAGGEVDGQELVTLAELHVARDLGGLPPAPDVGGRTQPGRHAPARGRDDEAVEAEAGDVGQLRERAERHRPGGVLAPQAPADQEAGDPRGGGARSQPGKRRRDDRAAGRAFAQRERVRRVGIGDQIERGGRQLAGAVLAVFPVSACWLQRESASVRRDVFGRAARSVRAGAGAKATSVAISSGRARRSAASRPAIASVASAPSAWPKRPSEAPAGACRPSSQPVPGGWRGRRGTGARNSSALQGRRGPATSRSACSSASRVQRRFVPALAARLRDRVEQQGEHGRIGRAPDGVVAAVAVQLDAVVAGRERGDVERSAAVQLGDGIQRLGERGLREALGGRRGERVLQAHQQRHEPRGALDRGALEGGRLARPVDQHGVDAAAVAAARERGEPRRPARELAVAEGGVRVAGERARRPARRARRGARAGARPGRRR